MHALYIHVPYCKTLCPYCDFVKARVSGDAPGAFTDALLKEIAGYEGPREVGSIFFGGGTPSLIAPADLARIMASLEKHFTLRDPECSLEANPDDLSPERIAGWKHCGINRVSLGVQSFEDTVLRYLGRRHDADGARRACDLIAGAFENWSLDLIFGAHPTTAWPATLAESKRIDPPHLSAYGLTYEPETPFGKRTDEAIDSDDSLAMYHALKEALADYDHYEISNFAKPGYLCRHNLVYWRNEGYAGFGPGAYAFLNGKRIRNAPSVSGYLKKPGAVCEVLDLSQEEIKVETLIQHFRLRQGITRAYYDKRFGVTVDADYGTILESLVARGLLKDDGETLAPTPKGYDLNNEIGLALVEA